MENTNPVTNDDLDLSESWFDLGLEDEENLTGEDDLSSGLSYNSLGKEDRRQVRKQIRKFRTGF